MLYQNLRSIGPSLMVRSTSNSFHLLSSSLLFFLPFFLFFSLLLLFFSSYPSSFSSSFPLFFSSYPFSLLLSFFFVGSPPQRFWLISSKNSLFLTLSSYLFSFLFFFFFFWLPHSSKPSSTSLKAWESGELGVWGDPMSPLSFFFFLNFLYIFLTFFLFFFVFFNVFLSSKF